MERYRHTQIGYVTIGATAPVFIFFVYVMTFIPFNGYVVAGFLTLGLVSGLFASLTVLIDGEHLKIRFGPGVIRKKFPLREITVCRVVKNPWYYGWGIHLTPHGWLYNVSGFSAVEIAMRSGKKYRIGTDVPQELERAIKQAIS